MSESDDQSPRLRVVHGSPTAEDLAVLAAVVVAASADTAHGSSGTARRGGWNDPATSRRRTMLPGPDGWRAAFRP